jgi:hypothetical protein
VDTGDSGQETCITGIRFLKMSLLIMALHCRWARFEARDATSKIFSSSVDMM